MIRLTFASHIHTSASDDSDWSLPRLAGVLSRAGFDGALVCDHDRTMTATRWDDLRAECTNVTAETGFVVVPGIEYQDPTHTIHVPVFGGAAEFIGRSPEIDDLLDAIADKPVVSVFAHPRRRDAWRSFDTSWAPRLGGMEVWSRKYDGIRPNQWALDASKEFGIPQYVSLDWHGPRQLYPLAMSVELSSSTPRGDHAAAAVGQLHAKQGRARAFGLPIDAHTTGILAAVGQGAETARRRLAPGLRRVERALRRSA